ncbi:hypothetical protein M8C21_032588 [Ambrosia artemisiifolia]|uniref:FMN-dependent dehydrogenase domain-containing protein n=1 Tax=Ambrosia artemisiifolia TaxID=4212 RepID=A0AAD5GGJ5_AMBAR|nr:hypothetical protein M8C21_032588 [Ambrosia artemisiifolia]
MNQELNQRIPHFNLKSKILCRVVHTQLMAEQDTDEGYAQITLLPEADQSDQMSPDECRPEPARPTVHSFCKVLTASDTSTHATDWRLLDKFVASHLSNDQAPSKPLKSSHMAEHMHLLLGESKSDEMALECASTSTSTCQEAGLELKPWTLKWTLTNLMLNPWRGKFRGSWTENGYQTNDMSSSKVADLSYDGETGVRKTLQMLHDELELTMALSGCRSLKEISRNHIVAPWDPPRVTPRL